MFEIENGIPAILLEPGLVKTRQELFGFKALPKSSMGRRALMVRCKGILEQVTVKMKFLIINFNWASSSPASGGVM